MIQLNPDDTDAYCQRGISRHLLENYQGGIEDFSQAIQLEPDNQMAYFGQGISHRQLGDNQAALADYTKVISA